LQTLLLKKKKEIETTKQAYWKPFVMLVGQVELSCTKSVLTISYGLFLVVV